MVKTVTPPLPTINRQIHAIPGEEPPYSLDKGKGVFRRQNCDALEKRKSLPLLGNSRCYVGQQLVV